MHSKSTQRKLKQSKVINQYTARNAMQGKANQCKARMIARQSQAIEVTQGDEIRNATESAARWRRATPNKAMKYNRNW